MTTPAIRSARPRSSSEDETACPVCDAEMVPARTGRPRAYCSTSCRQIAYRARARADRAAERARAARGHLADVHHRLDSRGADLASALAVMRADVTEAAAGAADPDAAALAGDRWEPRVADLAREISRLAAQVGDAAWEHNRHAGEHAHATAPANRHTPAARPSHDETPTGGPV